MENSGDLSGKRPSPHPGGVGCMWVNDAPDDAADSLPEAVFRALAGAVYADVTMKVYRTHADAMAALRRAASEAVLRDLAKLRRGPTPARRGEWIDGVLALAERARAALAGYEQPPDEG